MVVVHFSGNTPVLCCVLLHSGAIGVGFLTVKLQ